jgi:hypothetical protein
MSYGYGRDDGVDAGTSIASIIKPTQQNKQNNPINISQRTDMQAEKEKKRDDDDEQNRNRTWEIEQPESAPPFFSSLSVPVRVPPSSPVSLTLFFSFVFFLFSFHIYIGKGSFNLYFTKMPPQGQNGNFHGHYFSNLV